MPNHVTNKLSMTGEESDIMEVLRTIQSDSQDEDGSHAPMDFNKIIPMPKGLDITSGSSEYDAKEIIASIPADVRSDPEKAMEYLKENVEKLLDVHPDTMKYIENYLLYGCTSWYDWSIKYWGTKWNAYSQDYDCETGVLSFDTAWATPVPVMLALSTMFPEVTFTIEYADEDIGRNCGTYVLKDGETLEDWEPENPDEFACGVKGYDYEEWKKEREQDS